MFSDWLEDDRGRAAMVATHFGVSKSAVSQWKDNGVPHDKMLAVRDLSGNVVTLEEMHQHAEAKRQKLKEAA